MPIERVPGTDLTYYLIAFDAAGRERAENTGERLSRTVADLLRRDPITDVFLISHGWKGDVPAAREQYGRWIGAMAGCGDDLACVRRARPGFRPLLIGLHWPSLPWGDESLSENVSFAPTEIAPVEELVDQAAERIIDTPAARAALETIFTAAAADVAPPTLPDHVRRACADLNREAALGEGGVAAPPGDDREPFDPERYYQLAQQAPVGFGGFSGSGLLVLLQQLSFWKMKDRARQFGETAGYELLTALQTAAGPGRDVGFHLMGHSFGCIAVSATVAGPGGRGALPGPVHSLALVQGALSLWSYCAEIPLAPGRAGYFASILDGRHVAGPIITTQSELDTAVGRYYPLGAGAAGQVAFAPGELPRYGAVGTYGIRGPGPEIVDLEMLPTDERYAFARGKVYNLESSRWIREGGGMSGAHNDIAHPEVAHAVWQAALS